MSSSGWPRWWSAPPPARAAWSWSRARRAWARPSSCASAGTLAEAAGLRVLRGRGAELDRAFAFGVVRQLLEREVAQHAAELLEGRRRAGGGRVFGAGGTRRAEDGLLGSLQGLLWLVANLAAQQPLLLVADDLHWADAASLRWLVFLAERLEDVPVLLVAATRPAEPGADQELLDALMTAPAAHALRPAPLSEEAARRWCATRLPGRGRELRRRVSSRDRRQPVPARRAASTSSPPRGSPGPTRTPAGCSTSGRARRPRRAPAAAAAARGGDRDRARGGGARAVRLARGGGGAGRPAEDAAAASADALADVHVLAASRSLDFVHPLVRAAVYDADPAAGAPGAARRGGRDADGTRRRGRGGGAPSAAPAAGGTTRGASTCCARPPATRPRAAPPRPPPHYLRRALEEPPAAAERGAVLHELGVAEATDRQRERLRGHLREAMAVTQRRARRGRRSRSSSAARSRPAVTSAPPSTCSTARCATSREPDDELGAALEAELLAMAGHDFTSTRIAAPALERRFAQLEAGELVHPWIAACLVHTLRHVARPGRVRDPPRLRRDRDRSAGRAQQRRRRDAREQARSTPGRRRSAGGSTTTRSPRRRRAGSRLTVAWQSVMRSDALAATG